MNERLINVTLISDNSILAAVSADFRSLGGMMICNGCGDLDTPIVALLVIEQDEEVWPFCGECLQRLPLAGPIV